jgi:hypothetical protein
MMSWTKKYIGATQSVRTNMVINLGYGLGSWPHIIEWVVYRVESQTQTTTQFNSNHRQPQINSNSTQLVPNWGQFNSNSTQIRIWAELPQLCLDMLRLNYLLIFIQFDTPLVIVSLLPLAPCPNQWEAPHIDHPFHLFNQSCLHRYGLDSSIKTDSQSIKTDNQSVKISWKLIRVTFNVSRNRGNPYSYESFRENFIRITRKRPCVAC